MADRITDEVNGILCQEAGAPSLSKQAVLDLIDQGASQGGPQAGLATSALLPIISCIVDATASWANSLLFVHVCRQQLQVLHNTTQLYSIDTVHDMLQSFANYGRLSCTQSSGCITCALTCTT